MNVEGSGSCGTRAEVRTALGGFFGSRFAAAKGRTWLPFVFLGGWPECHGRSQVFFCARPDGLALPGGWQGCQGNGPSRAEGRKACAWWAFVHSGPPPPCGQGVGERLFLLASLAGLGGFCPRLGETLVGVVASAKRSSIGQRCGVFLSGEGVLFFRGRVWTQTQCPPELCGNFVARCLRAPAWPMVCIARVVCDGLGSSLSSGW